MIQPLHCAAKNCLQGVRHVRVARMSVGQMGGHATKTVDGEAVDGAVFARTDAGSAVPAPFGSSFAVEAAEVAASTVVAVLEPDRPGC